MANNNINTHSVSDLDYKEIIANIEKDIKSLKEQSIAKLSQQDQEDLDLLYDIVAENEENKIIEIEQEITNHEMKLSAAKNRIELQEKQHEDSRKQLNNHITYQANISQMSIDEVIKKNPSHIVGCDPNLNILDNINNDDLFTLASRIIGRKHKFFQSLQKNIHTKKVGILWLFLFFPVYFYKKHKIKKMKLFGEKTLRFYKFSKAEIKELKKIITEIYKGELKNDAAYVERLVADQPINLQNLEDAKKEHEGFLIKENERISGLKQKSNELKERIKWEIQNAGELLKRRPYLDSFLQGRT